MSNVWTSAVDDAMFDAIRYIQTNNLFTKPRHDRVSMELPDGSSTLPLSRDEYIGLFIKEATGFQPETKALSSHTSVVLYRMKERMENARLLPGDLDRMNTLRWLAPGYDQRINENWGDMLGEAERIHSQRLESGEAADTCMEDVVNALVQQQAAQKILQVLEPQKELAPWILGLVKSCMDEDRCCGGFTVATETAAILGITYHSDEEGIEGESDEESEEEETAEKPEEESGEEPEEESEEESSERSEEKSEENSRKRARMDGRERQFGMSGGMSFVGV